MTLKDELALRQAAAKQVHDKLFEVMCGFSPTMDLTVNDLMFIARMAQTISFDAHEAIARGKPSS